MVLAFESFGEEGLSPTPFHFLTSSQLSLSLSFSNRRRRRTEAFSSLISTMEKHNCKLCFKQFSNGKALGGHMKSHMSILQTPPPLHPPAKTQLIEIESASSTGDEEEEEEEEEVKNGGGGGLNYRLRENPKKSFRLVDPVFSSPMDTGSIVLDRESETDESFKNKNNPTRRRSKRTRKSSVGSNQILKKPKIMINHHDHQSSSPVESEPAVSSVSDTTPDEDVARCLMMLSRDVWMKQVEEVEDEDEDEEEEEEEKSIDDESEEEEIRLCMNQTKKRKKKKYQCESCKKFFRSYQALGGHRASHKKVRSCISFCSSSIEKSELLQKGTTTPTTSTNAVTDQKFHECPICFKLFKNRQALGGHKRSHQQSTSFTPTPTSSTPNSFKFKPNMIDLNFPAPIEEEDVDPI